MSTSPNKKLLRLLRIEINYYSKFFKNQTRCKLDKLFYDTLHSLHDISSRFRLNLSIQFKKDSLYLAELLVSIYNQKTTLVSDDELIKRLYGTTLPEEIRTNLLSKIYELKNKWQNKKLDVIYPVVVIDIISFQKLNKKIYVLSGVDTQEKTELLSIWYVGEDNNNIWNEIFLDLKERGVRDILVLIREKNQLITDAFNRVFPLKNTQLVCNSLFNKIVDFHGTKNSAEPATMLYNFISLSENHLYRTSDKKETDKIVEFYSRQISHYLMKSKALKKIWEDNQKEIQNLIFNSLSVITMPLIR